MREVTGVSGSKCLYKFADSEFFFCNFLFSAGDVRFPYGQTKKVEKFRQKSKNPQVYMGVVIFSYFSPETCENPRIFIQLFCENVARYRKDPSVFCNILEKFEH